MLDALRGIRVLDLTRVLAGPFGTMILADLGADVIKIERPAGGDDTRTMGPYFVGEVSAYFASVNRSKRSCVIDLRTESGRAVLHDLARNADVLVQNFRPAVAARLGCDAPTLSSVAPRLIVCSMSAFGADGCDASQPAFDLVLQARGGTMGLTGEPGRLPVRMGPPMGDLAGGFYLAIAVNAALFSRTRTGRGTCIDLSLLDAQASLLTYAASFYLNDGVELGPQGTAHAQAFPYQLFRTADEPIVVAVFTDAFWPPFCRAIGKSAWADDASLATHAARKARASELLAEIEPLLEQQAATYWIEAFRREEVPASRVNRVGEVFDDPQLRGRAMVAEMHHPAAGTLRAVGNPLKIGDHWRTETHGPPPRLGEHTDAVLREIAQYDDEQIASLLARRVVT